MGWTIGLQVTAVLVERRFTVWLAVPDEPLKFGLALLVAVIVLAPAEVEVRLHDPAGPERAMRQLALPSETVTVPVGVPTPGAADANATDTEYNWPATVAVLARDEAFVIVVVVFALVIVMLLLSELPKW